MSKDELIEALSKEGFRTGFANNGIPTVFVKSALDIEQARKAVKEAVTRFGYTQSYGIGIADDAGNAQ